ncbi:lipopolysaccharide biosynthesis protein [Patiriisocius sp. Uisw_017]|uniref:lipopolysaccharide biosynthesis protein n=1 Tax=Patiriisocius sp. Uisw_017 TaxID=3230968 RepID=UPI0039ED79ED
MANLKKLASDTAIYGLGSVIKKIVGLFLLPFYTRVLSPAEYGILDSLGTFSFFIAVIFGLGITGATGRYFFIANTDTEKGSVLYTSIILRIFSTVLPIIVMLFFADNISSLLFKTDKYTWVVVLSLVLIPVQSISQMQEVLFRYYRKPWKYLIVSGLRSVVTPIFGISLVVVLQWGVFGATLASLISSSFIMVFAYLFYTRKKYIRKFSPYWAKKMLRFGFPLIFTGMLMWVNSVSDRFFLLHYSSLNEIGFYSIGSVFSQPIMLLNMAIAMSSSVLLMSMFTDEEDENKPKTKAFFKETFNLYISIAVIIAVVVSVFSYEIVFYVTTPEYISSILAIPFLLFGLILDQSFQMTASGMTLKEKSRPYIWISLIAASTNVLLNFYFIPKYGFLGAAITTILSNIVFFVVGYNWSQRYFKVDWKIHKHTMLLIVTFCIALFFPFAQLKFGLNINIWYKLIVIIVSLGLPFVFRLIEVKSVIKRMTLIFKNK